MSQNEAKPPVNETKVENTTEQVKKKTEKRNTETTKPPPTPPTSPTKPEKMPKVDKTDVWDTKKTSSFLKKNRGAIALGAIGVGIATSWIDGEDDDVLSSAGKGAKTGAVVAAAAYGSEHLLKTETVQSMVRGEVAEVSKNVRKKVDIGDKMTRGWGRLGTAAKIGLGAFGAATVLDVGNKIKEHADSAHIKAQQEQQIVERQKKKKQKQKKDSYGHLRDGEILFEMFDTRTGHHKMGNAKFS